MELWVLNCLGALSVKESGGVWRRCASMKTFTMLQCMKIVSFVVWTSAGVCSASQLSSRQTSIPFSICLFFGCVVFVWIHRICGCTHNHVSIPVAAVEFRLQYCKHMRMAPQLKYMHIFWLPELRVCWMTLFRRMKVTGRKCFDGPSCP